MAALLAGLVVGLVTESPATATTPPTTSVLVPATGATLSGTTALDASAPNATSVEFWLFGGSYGLTGDMIGTATLTPYGWVSSWNTTTVPNASYALLSVAFNASGSAFSTRVSITVSNPPTTSVLVPATGATLSGTTTLDASAPNATSVEFWLFGGSYGLTGDMIGTATLTPYGWVSSWNTTTVPNASYALLTEAFNAGGSGFSAAVTVTVNNPPPPMLPPAGHTSQQMIFDDQFSGTSLDADDWVTYLGADGHVWNNFGSMPLPYSAGNSVANGGSGDNISMYSPSQVTVNNGLTLTAQPNTNQWSSTYPWISGVVTTEGKFTLPTSGWYVQVKAEMPDQSRGMWPAIWFLCGTSCPDENELDGYEGGFLLGSTNPNDVMHSDYFTDQGQQESAYNVGADMTAGYNVYGFQFIPGQSITAYFNGKQVWQVNASSRVTITSAPYQIMLELQVAGTPTSGWHAVASSGTPTSSMKVAEVQVYGAP